MRFSSTLGQHARTQATTAEKGMSPCLRPKSCQPTAGAAPAHSGRGSLPNHGRLEATPPAGGSRQREPNHRNPEEAPMANVKEITGQRFGRLVALYPTGERRYRKVVWRFRCDCGN